MGVATVAAVLAAPLSAGGVAVGVKVFTAHEDPIGESRPPADLAQAPEDLRPGVARAKDPGNSTVWGVRLYYNPRGESCALVGMVGPGGGLGVVKGGRFRPFPKGAPGRCHNMRDHVFVTSSTYVDIEQPRTVLYGIVDRAVRGLTLGFADGRRRRIAIAPDGTYVVPLPGRGSLSGAKLEVAAPAGSVVKPLDPRGTSSAVPPASLGKP
jgi:hypothetical protein